MTVTAPAASKWRVADSERLSAISRGASAATHERDGHVDPQHPLPAEALGEDPAEEHAGGAAGSGDGAPGAERLVALGAVAEGGGDDRERRGGDDRRAQALGGARGDQLTLGRAKPAASEAARDEQEPGDEHAPAPEQVREPPAEQQEAAEGEHVGVHDPGQVLLGEVEPLADRRERDVDDRRVEHDDELREAEQREGDPAAAFELLGWWSSSGSSSAFRALMRVR